MSRFISGVPSNQTNKNSGEVAQSLLYAEIMKRGLTPLVTFGDNLPWDLVVYNQEVHQFFRIQVKSTYGKVRGRLKWTVSKGGRTKRSYTAESVDLVALHDFESGDWWLVPVSEVVSKKSLTVGPRQDSLNVYKNDWSLFESD